jgi:hypothetical protein
VSWNESLHLPRYRTEGVDTYPATPQTFGVAGIGHVEPGEWLEYTMDVAAEGLYDLTIRLAHAKAGGTFHIRFDGVNRTGPLRVPDTGGWLTFKTLTVSRVRLAKGRQIMRIVFDERGADNSAVGNFDSITIRPAAAK